MTEPNTVEQDKLDSFLGDLQHELSVMPSPDFAARVRARVERETSRAWSPSRWFFGAFALASAAVVLIMFWNRPAPVRPPDAVVASHQPPAATPPTTQPSAIAPAATSSTPVASRPVRRPRGAASLHATSQGPVSADLVSGDPMTVDPTIRTLEVIVPPDQELALRRLLVAMRAGGGGAQPPESSLPASEPLPALPLIVIAPIRIDALPRSVTGGGRR